MKLEYHPQTVTDYREASDHYERISSDLQRQFRIEVLSALERILANPSLYAEVQGIRRALLKRFPYSVVYRIVDASTVRVLVIRHHKRHPAFGRDRN